MFGHEPRTQETTTEHKASLETKESPAFTDFSDDHAPKRRKLDDAPGYNSILPVKGPQLASRSSTGAFKGPSSLSSIQVKAVNERNTSPVLQTLDKPVTPPPLHGSGRAGAAAQKKLAPTKPAKKESLNPRMVPNDPAGHGKRTLFLQYMHEQMKRLNTEITKGDHPDKDALTLGDDELIRAALDEEEKLARDNPKVYGNIIKNRIGTYKKWKVEDWTTYVIATFTKAVGKDEESSVASVEDWHTGPPGYEHLFLPELITDQSNLAKHGYVPTPLSHADIVEAEGAVAASLNYEVCDRCKSRFRVFPDRREVDGALTTNGPCIYHWGRPFTPKREKTDAIKGVKDSVYSCCNELLGTKGCTECETHVFKISEAKRLAVVLPFVNTPENPNPAKAPNGKPPVGVTFDCEMGYTVCGFELIRLTAVSWPEGDPLVDVLVRPQGTILDLNSRFSGVWPAAYNAAIPYQDDKTLDDLMPPPPPGTESIAPPSSKPASPAKGPLPIVSSPAAARDLLCTYITPQTPLIGHALENDLNSVRLCHPTIIDTIVLFPHPKGLPLRFGLKMLSKRHLNRDIQMGGASGHDSLEDARATGDLVRKAVGSRWKKKKAEGWFVSADGQLMPPLPSGMPVEAQRVLGQGAGNKRQRI